MTDGYFFIRALFLVYIGFFALLLGVFLTNNFWLGYGYVVGLLCFFKYLEA